MGLTEEQLVPIKDEFEAIYFSPEPYIQFVNLCGITTLRSAQESSNKEIKLKPGESLDDLCLSVGFREQPPAELEFPSEFKSVRVFYEVIGEIKFL